MGERHPGGCLLASSPEHPGPKSLFTDGESDTERVLAGFLHRHPATVFPQEYGGTTSGRVLVGIHKVRERRRRDPIWPQWPGGAAIESQRTLVSPKRSLRWGRESDGWWAVNNPALISRVKCEQPGSKIFRQKCMRLVVGAVLQC